MNPNTQELIFLKTVYIFHAHKAWCNHWIPVVNSKKPDHSSRSAQLTLEPCPGCQLHDANITKPSHTTRLDPLFCDIEINLSQSWHIPSGPLTRKKKNDPSSHTTIFPYSFREYVAEYNRTNLHLQRFPPIDHYANYRNILTSIPNTIV